MNRLLMTDAQREEHDRWMGFDIEAVGPELTRWYLVPPHVAAAITGRLRNQMEFAAHQQLLRGHAERRIAWLESQVDPELLKPEAVEAVTCKPPPEASD